MGSVPSIHKAISSISTIPSIPKHPQPKCQPQASTLVRNLKLFISALLCPSPPADRQELHNYLQHLYRNSSVLDISAREIRKGVWLADVISVFFFYIP